MAKLERIESQHETVMDVTEERIARVYAQAFVGAISKTENPAAHVEELESLINDVLAIQPKLVELFRSELISAEQKEVVIEKVFASSASTLLLNFLKVLARHERLSVLRTILKFVKKTYAEQMGLAEVQVRVAKELDAELEQEIVAKLRSTLGKEPVLTITVDPELIGGMILQVGDRVYDGSIHRRLEQIRRSIVDRATEMIETAPEKFLVRTG